MLAKRVFWVPLGASNFKHTALGKLQAMHPPDDPLAAKTEAERDVAWVAITEKLVKALANPI